MVYCWRKKVKSSLLSNPPLHICIDQRVKNLPKNSKSVPAKPVTTTPHCDMAAVGLLGNSCSQLHFKEATTVETMRRIEQLYCHNAILIIKMAYVLLWLIRSDQYYGLLPSLSSRPHWSSGI